MVLGRVGAGGWKGAGCGIGAGMTAVVEEMAPSVAARTGPVEDWGIAA